MQNLLLIPDFFYAILFRKKIIPFLKKVKGGIWKAPFEININLQKNVSVYFSNFKKNNETKKELNKKKLKLKL